MVLAHAGIARPRWPADLDQCVRHRPPVESAPAGRDDPLPLRLAVVLAWSGRRVSGDDQVVAEQRPVTSVEQVRQQHQRALGVTRSVIPAKSSGGCAPSPRWIAGQAGLRTPRRALVKRRLGSSSAAGQRSASNSAATAPARLAPVATTGCAPRSARNDLHRPLPAWSLRRTIPVRAMALDDVRARDVSPQQVFPDCGVITAGGAARRFAYTRPLRPRSAPPGTAPGSGRCATRP